VVVYRIWDVECRVRVAKGTHILHTLSYIPYPKFLKRRSRIRGDNDVDQGKIRIT
jgi:hypothetical protein